MNTYKVTFVAALAAMAVTLTLGVAPALTNQAFAAIEEVVIDEFCENPSGAQPPGQQDNCQGEAQTPVVVTENQNPAGHAPPGQN